MSSPLLFLFILSLYGWMHYLVYRRIADGLGLSSRNRYLLIGTLVVMGTLPVVAMFLRRSAAATDFFLIAVRWLGILLILLCCLFVEWILSLLWEGERRRFVSAALGVASAAVLFSLWNGARDPAVREVIVPLRKLPESLQDFRIVQLSDLHLGHSMSAVQWERIVRQVLGLKADLIVITGDLLDRHVCESEPAYCRALGMLQARYGVYAVPGNHDYYTGYPYVAEMLKNTGIRLLRNQGVAIGDLHLVGVDDDEGSVRGFPREDLSRMLSGIDPQKTIVLLSHRPFRFLAAVRLGVDLQISGHTHGGQIPPLDLLTWLLFRYWHGLYPEGDAYIYASCGTSTWGPRMRLFSRSEIVLLCLTGRE